MDPPASPILQTAFAIDELVGLILRQLDGDRPALANFAQTKRSLSQGAIALLWQSLDSIAPLLKLLPEDSFSLDTSYDPWRFNTKRLFSHDDWARFEHHAPLVRKLGYVRINGGYGSILDKAVMHTLRRRGQRTLLPNLKTLEWRIYHAEDLRALCCLLTPNLVSLRVEQYNTVSTDFPHPSEFIHYVEEMQQLSPRLTELKLVALLYFENTSAERVESFKEPFINLLQSQRAIRTLIMDQEIFTAILPQLPPLPDLTSIHLDARGLLEAIEPETLADALKVLPALRTVKGDLDWGGNIFWTMFLPVIGLNIQEISLGLGQSNAIFAANATELLAAIGDSCRSLQSLTVDHMNISGDAIPVHLSGFLRPLVQCKELIKLKVHSSHTFDVCLTLSDNDVLEMALVWKNIETLQIGCESYDAGSEAGERPPLTMNAIEVLCRHCPKLQTLQLTVDAENCPQVPPVIPATALTKLDLGRSWIGDFCDVAAWLGEVCPAEGISNAPGARSEKWENVRRHAGALQAGRKLERAQKAEIETLRAQFQVLQMQLENRNPF